MFRRVYKVATTSAKVIRTHGPATFFQVAGQSVYGRIFPEGKKKPYKDILFINGCTLPHPQRYRVHHQMEQLNSRGLTTDEVFYEKLDLDQLKYYRGFVFFRCPVTDTVKEFISRAKKQNKTCFFDIDDLVIDQKYTNQIKYVQQMSLVEKQHYDDGVNRMRQTLELCDYAITTTDRMKVELENYTKEVFINRNVASDEMIAESNKALATARKNPSRVVIGYFSGSITHNEDFQMILPSLMKLLAKHRNVYLKITGLLDVPKELKEFSDRVITTGFSDWRKMPYEMASCDINLAPLTNTVFNEAKSENKWVEAALVKVVTAASNIGAFKDAVVNNQTGVLVEDDEWFKALDDLIVDSEKRQQIAARAHKEVLANNTTVAASCRIDQIIRHNLVRNIAFMLPSTDISGGINVILKHAEILRENDWDVTLIDMVDKKMYNKSRKQYEYRESIEDFSVVRASQAKITAFFDTMVSTLWATLEHVKKYPNVKNRLYFVQNFETGFYSAGDGKLMFDANSTYADQTGVRYITMSPWCEKWLKEDFDQVAKRTSNGIDLKNYPIKQRSFSKDQKIKILIEGDSKSEYKNTDEAFKIVERLDPNRYEISYLSYRKEPKDWYRVDHFYNRIAPEKVGRVYAANDILIKTSLLESFSYPPLEMMATGGLCVVLPNDGNIEYLRDRENCLFYEGGNIEDGVNKIEELVDDRGLRDSLIENGLKTAEKYAWSNVEAGVLSLYQDS